MRSWMMAAAAMGGAALLALACGDDVTNAQPVVDAGTTDASSDTTSDTTIPDAGGGDVNDTSVPDPVLRGQYIVDHLANCGDCHTPRKPDGTLDPTRYLSGVECFVGTHLDAGSDAGGPGCLNSRNLTNDATGLMNRTGQQIRDMFQNGVRPNGEFLNPFMPYWAFHNLTDDDANALVAYLRTVPGVVHAVPPSEPPWNNVLAAAAPIDMSTVPLPPSGSANEASAKAGRYLAATAALCIDCHTPETSPGNGQLDRSKWFAGSRGFPSASLGLPSPPFPAMIWSANLTQDPTGLQGYAATDIVKEIRMGKDRNGGGVCPPMPVGPLGGFGGMTPTDAFDIANYVLTLPGIANARPQNCVAP